MSQVLIITGMHRSGTSMVSSLLHTAGLHLGDQLLAGNSANPHGYFEDVTFFEFHERLLHRREQTYLYLNPDCDFRPSDDEREQARLLIAERSCQPMWGWKDPRTSLFLEFWLEQLPEARFLFVFRHPLEVLLSLLRRGEFDCHPFLSAGLEAWQIYNAGIKAFVDSHPDRCVLVHIEGVVGQIEQFFSLLRQKLHVDIHLDAESFARIYKAQDLNKTPLPPEATSVLAVLQPGLIELYRYLNEAADLPESVCQPSIAGSSQASALATFAAGMPTPLSRGVQCSLLQLLASQLAPELTEAMLVRFHQNIQGTQRRIDELWMQVLQLQRTDVQQRTLLEGQLLRLETQQADLEMQELELATQRAQLEELLRKSRVRAEPSHTVTKRVWGALQNWYGNKAG